MFKVNNENHLGLIKSIFSGEANEVLFELRPLSNRNVLSVSADGPNLDLPSIQKGSLKIIIISVPLISLKNVYIRNRNKKIHFFRYPKLEENSKDMAYCICS